MLGAPSDLACSYGPGMDDDVNNLIRTVFDACAKLTLLTGRPVSPDGHLVGTLGEIVASEALDLELMPPSNDGYDATDSQGRKVEIKTTTRRSIGIANKGTAAERLVVVTLNERGTGQVVYDGPIQTALDMAGPPRANGQRTLALSKLVPGPSNS